MNYYHRYSGDYIKKTLDLVMIEDGAYTRLLDWMYANERPVPHEKRHIITRCQSLAERKAVDAVLHQFFAQDGDHWTHERTQETIEEARPRIEAAQANGKKGGRPKGSTKAANKKPTGLFDENPDLTQGESSPYPIPHNSVNTVAVDSTEVAPGNPEFAPTKVGQVGMALKAAGINLATINLNDPRFTELIRQGATPEEFGGLAAEAIKKGIEKPFPWIIAALPKRREDAARIVLTPKAATAIQTTTVPSEAANETQRLLAEQDAHAAVVARERAERLAARAATQGQPA